MMLTAIVEYALRAGALAIMVRLALLVLRVRSPKVERIAWLAVLLSALSMPLLMKLTELSPAKAPDLAWLQHLSTIASSSQSPTVQWQAILLGVFIVIATALLIRQSAGVVRWWNVRRIARPILSPLCAGSDVRASCDVDSPATVFSTILVPVDFETLPEQAQRAVIAHERTHVENRDFYVQWLAQVHRSVFWFSPLAWWLPRRLSILSEHLSDDAAIAAIQDRTTYADVLLRFAQRAIRNDQIVAMARTATLVARIERILTEDEPFADGRMKTLFLVITLLSVIVVVAGFQAVAAKSMDQPAASQLLIRHGEAGNSGSSAAAIATAASAARVVLPKSNVHKPLSAPTYPPASRRLQEHGTVILKLHVLEDGSVDDAIVDESSGYPSLDSAAMNESLHWQLDPGTVDDAPSRMWGRFAVTFKLPE